MNRKILLLLAGSIINMQASLPDRILKKIENNNGIYGLFYDAETFDVRDQQMITKEITGLLPASKEMIEQSKVNSSYNMVVSSYAYSQLFSLGDAENDRRLFLVVLYSVFIIPDRAPDDVFMASVKTTIESAYPKYMLDILLALEEPTTLLTQEMFDKMIKTLIYLHNSKQVSINLDNMIADSIIKARNAAELNFDVEVFDSKQFIEYMKLIFKNDFTSISDPATKEISLELIDQKLARMSQSAFWAHMRLCLEILKHPKILASIKQTKPMQTGWLSNKYIIIGLLIVSLLTIYTFFCYPAMISTLLI